MKIFVKNTILFLLTFIFSRLPLDKKKTLVKNLLNDKFAETFSLLQTLPGVASGAVYREGIDGFDYLQQSFGQNGEDLVLNRILDSHQKGTYLDIGAYHPFKFSNTALLYKNGWTGVNIDASDLHLELFSKHRPKDLSIRMAVTKDGGALTFYEYKQSAFNTFCDARVNDLMKLGISPVGNLSVETIAFRNVVKKYAREDTFVLNIDIEGLDYGLLEDSVFEWFKPCIIIFESNTTIDLEITRLRRNPLLSDYVIASVTFNSFILRSKNCALLHLNLGTDLETN